MRRSALLLALVLALPAAASESFTLNIPKRFNANQEIGEVRIRLGLNAAPAGAQLVVGGSATLSLGDTQTVAGDSVSFTSLPSNRVLIRYRPLTNFAGDFCQGAGAADKAIALRFSGAQDVVDYRVGSFVVGAPDYECSDVSRRVADTPATITPSADGVAPALSATDAGRLPLDVVLVLDKSGSMADLPPGASPSPMNPSKAAILKSAVDAFVADWRQIDQPSGSGEWSEDRIGVVFFDSTAAPQTLAGADPPANFFVQRGAMQPPGPTAWDAVINDVNTLAPGASTSIGAGINAAMQQWKSDPAHDVTLVLVTDGMQNTAPLISTSASGIVSLTPVAGLPDELRKRFIPIETIGFGSPAQIDEDLMKHIALQTAGQSYMPISATTMFDTFAMTLVAILKGNTASIGSRRAARLSGAAPAPGLNVVVDKTPRRVVFSLQWAPPGAGLLDMDVFRPGASTVATPDKRESLPQAALQTFELKPSDAGTWRVLVRRNPHVKSRAPVPYSLHAFFLESHLDYRLSLERDRVIRLELSYDGRPLTHLPSGAAIVKVLRPTATLDQLLREKSSGAKPQPTHGDPQTDLQRRIALLPPAQIEKLQPAESTRVVLREEGRGVYTAPLGSTALPGLYALELTLDFDDERLGHIHREERLETVIDPLVKR
jgi:von Willebrand factor type A domain